MVRNKTEQDEICAAKHGKVFRNVLIAVLAIAGVTSAGTFAVYQKLVDGLETRTRMIEQENAGTKQWRENIAETLKRIERKVDADTSPRVGVKP